jgi:hypothetical protein
MIGAVRTVRAIGYTSRDREGVGPHMSRDREGAGSRMSRDREEPVPV